MTYLFSQFNNLRPMVEGWVQAHPYLTALATLHCKDPWKVYEQAGRGLYWLVKLVSRSKERHFMFNPIAIMAGAMSVASTIAAFIPAVEAELGPGTGPEKKALVITRVQSAAPAVLDKLSVPPWAQGILLKPEVLGMMIDGLVTLVGKAHDLLADALAQPTEATAVVPQADGAAVPG